MLTYLYGLVLGRNAHLVPAHITGVGGAVVRVVECDRVGALVSTIATRPRSASLDDIRAHDHALQAVVHHGATVASVRFGQSFRDDEEMRGHVSALDERLGGLLEQRDGCVEMRLLLALGARPTDERGREPKAQRSEPTGPGTAYLQQISGAASRERMRGLALRDALGPMVIAERVEEIAEGRGAAFSHLIRRDDEGAYREAVAGQPSLAAATVVGPLAFYSFATDE